MIKLDHKWMNLALKIAKINGERSEVPIGAVLVDLNSDSIISKSGNQIIKKNNPLEHAELIVIKSALRKTKRKYLDNAALYVTLEPCIMCGAAILETRIKKLYFGAYDMKKGAFEKNFLLFKNKSYFKTEIYGGIKENDCSKLIKNFFKDIRKKDKLNEYRK